MTTADVNATASSSGEQHATAPSEATAMDEEAADMEYDGDEGGGGASSSDGRQAARAMGVDVDELEVRTASETSARLAAQVDGQPRVRKRTSRGTKGANRKKTGDQKAMEKKQGDRGGED